MITTLFAFFFLVWTSAARRVGHTGQENTRGGAHSPLLELLLAQDPAGAFNSPGLSTWKSTHAASKKPTSRRLNPPKMLFDIGKLGLPGQKAPGLEMLEVTEPTVGEGRRANRGDRVMISYKSRVLPDGEPFDVGEIQVILGEEKIIPGWEKGLFGIQKGTTRIIKVPANLAYGDMGAAPDIPPGADLEYETTCQWVRGKALDSVVNSPFFIPTIVLFLLYQFFQFLDNGR